MAKNNKKNHNYKGSKNDSQQDEKVKYPILTLKLKRWVALMLLVLLGIVLVLSFFGWAGSGGSFLLKALRALVGIAVYFVPALMLVAGILIFKPQKKRVVSPTILATVLLLCGIAGLFAVLMFQERGGGWLGYALSWPFFRYFGGIVA
ncbi:MAG: DNA translocase FtsK 4TM domain-containing protein, partial [Candidatus Pacebacteria bacterium]|nr:DNA translocase FtsK 4TM domain-containing protein [Candidatus Paceibacterota bacterium]